jgi:hypothetical protein
LGRQVRLPEPTSGRRVRANGRQVFGAPAEPHQPLPAQLPQGPQRAMTPACQARRPTRTSNPRTDRNSLKRKYPQKNWVRSANLRTNQFPPPPNPKAPQTHPNGTEMSSVPVTSAETDQPIPKTDKQG